ncbi:hypothetical protein C8Q77DRAFT_1115911 [Trametes polyzona]|nr:hypothetical protein C8Q77DRAFT_1115911 [Trametes polyzona]
MGMRRVLCHSWPVDNHLNSQHLPDCLPALPGLDISPHKLNATTEATYHLYAANSLEFTRILLPP